MTEIRCPECGKRHGDFSEGRFVTQLSKGKNRNNETISYFHGDVMTVECCKVTRRYIVQGEWYRSETILTREWVESL